MPCWAWRCPAQVKLRVLVRTDMKLTSKACSARASKFLRNASCCPLGALRYDVIFFFFLLNASVNNNHIYVPIMKETPGEGAINGSLQLRKRKNLQEDLSRYW